MTETMSEAKKPMPSPMPAASHGLGPDSCYAKKISTSGGHDGTTKTR